ncbi:RNA binding motif protein 11 [Trichomycterus rosablanca]|uniref:RNA binding motif protein 11 n=1 Tax=Trichomycterus rosablanca TaxID=2290929 RepID=UPI002F358623
MEECEAALTDRTVCVHNLNSSVTEEILYELFLQAGPVQKLVVLRGSDQKSLALVSYKHAESVPYAAALLDGIRLYGRPIRLSWNHLFAQHTEYQNLQNRPAENCVSGILDDASCFYHQPNTHVYSWRDTMSGLVGDHFAPLMHPAEGSYCPPVPLWAWPHPGFVPWTCSDAPNQLVDFSNSGEAGGEQNIRNKKRKRRKHEKKQHNKSQ